MALTRVRVWLLPLLLLASEAWALGLGEIRLSSALNEPLDAEIELLSATPDELDNLRVQLASAETFARYDLDRPLFLTRLEFDIVESGRAGGSYIRVTSSEPVTEPFITFLVEASWSRGRLLREYTLLLDPPTFAPPPSTQATQPLTAPTRQPPADSGEIERPAPREPAPSRPAVQAPVQTPQRPTQQLPGEQGPVTSEPTPSEPAPEPVRAETPPSSGQPEFNSTPGGDVVVLRGDTLWGITQRVRPDSRLSINQTMLAIFEANPDAFDGNINMLRAGATLRIPSADDIFRIGRREAFTEVARQNAAWSGSPLPPPRPAVTPAVAGDPGPSLTLVPPDEDDSPLPTTGAGSTADDLADASVPDTVADTIVDPVEERIREIESILQDQDSLIEIPSNELAALRAELANLRGEPLDTSVEGPPEDDQVFVDEGPDAPVQDQPAVEESPEPEVRAAPAVVRRIEPEDGIFDRALAVVTTYWWAIIGTALVFAVLILVWFMRRGSRDSEDATGVWDTLDADEMEVDTGASGRLGALAKDDDSIVVVETEQADGDDHYDLDDDFGGDTVLRPPAGAARPPAAKIDIDDDLLAETGPGRELNETFSSETAINLDQSDPVAEADFHMAYGLYDQAADLINGALEADPDREDLLSKLCEIYFVWGNRDGFVDAAIRRKLMVPPDGDPEWDKIVIMGQQIAGDHELFSGVSAGGVTRAVDLSFDGGMEQGALDIDLAGDPDSSAIDFVDLGAEFGRNVGDETGQVSIAPDTGTGIDFDLDGDDEASQESGLLESTIEDRMSVDSTQKTSAANDDGAEIVDLPQADATAEIDLDDLGLDLDGIDDVMEPTDVGEDTGAGNFVDLGALDELDDIDEFEARHLLAGADDDDGSETGKNPELDDPFGLEASPTRQIPSTRSSRDETDQQESPAVSGELEETGTSESLVDFDFDSLSETGTSELLADSDDAAEIDESLKETGRNLEISIDDDEATGTREILDIEDALSAETAEAPALDADTSGTGLMRGLDEGDVEATGMMPAIDDDDEIRLADMDDGDATGLLPKVRPGDRDDESDDFDSSLFDATGHTQVLSGDMAVDSTDYDGTIALEDDAATLMASLDDEDDGEFDFAKTEALPKDAFGSEMSSDETGALPSLPGGTDLDLDLDDLTAALRVSEVGDTINQPRDDATVEQPRFRRDDDDSETSVTQALGPEDFSDDLHDARTMTEVGTKLDLARAYVDMGDPDGAKSILEEVLDEGDESQRQQAQKLLDSLPA